MYNSTSASVIPPLAFRSNLGSYGGSGSKLLNTGMKPMTSASAARWSSLKSNGQWSGGPSLLAPLSTAQALLGSVVKNASRASANPSQSGASGGTGHGGCA